MERRDFFKKGSLAALSPVIIPSFNFGINADYSSETIKVAPLKKGATIQLITPASAITRSAFEKCISNMRLLGYEVKYSDNLRVRSGFLSGTDEQRIEDLQSAFENKSVDAIFCARGGYGSSRLLPNINFDLIKNNPKPIIGYSDITALLLAIYKHTGMVGFHGPVGASSYTDFTIENLKAVLEDNKKIKIENDGSEALIEGTASGKLIGGNLSLLTSLIGTPDDPSYDDHILFIEEIGEFAYRIDRMLTQLVNSGKLNKVRGIVLGYFTDCDLEKGDPDYEISLSLKEVLFDRLGHLNIPICTGFPIGHEADNATLPIGINAELDARKGTLKLLENPMKG